MTVLWDVDTQVDFMLPDGKLYVRGAEQTAPAMQRLVEAARAAGIVHVASADDHELTDAEIADEPDFRTTYPPHCLRGTRGARKIPGTEQEDPVPITLELLPERDPYAFLVRPRRTAGEPKLPHGLPAAVFGHAVRRLVETARIALVTIGGLAALASLLEALH